MSETFEIFIQEPAKVKFPQIGKEYEIGELSLSQSIKFAKWFLIITQKLNRDELENLKKETDELKSLFKLVQLADDDLLNDFLGIILKEKDKEILKKLSTIPITFKILEILAQKNDVKEIIGNFQKAMTMIKSKKHRIIEIEKTEKETTTR